MKSKPVTTVNGILCPFCGHMENMNIGAGVCNGELYFDTDTVCYCTECGKRFPVHVEIRTMYTATKKEV